jgi:hypothetical protein
MFNNAGFLRFNITKVERHLPHRCSRCHGSSCATILRDPDWICVDCALLEEGTTLRFEAYGNEFGTKCIYLRCTECDVKFCVVDTSSLDLLECFARKVDDGHRHQVDARFGISQCKAIASGYLTN